MQELNAEKWLEEHANEIPSEDIIDEIKNNGFWPTPEKVKNLGIFSTIDNPDKFNEVLGNPQNWNVLRLRKDMYYKWVLPLAINLFGKKWFDCVKYRSQGSFGTSFAIFNEYEIKDAKENEVSIEKTSYGRAAISKIIIKISHAFEIYLKGGWIKKGHRTPGSYLVESIKNEFISEFNKELGNKIKQDQICPNCLISGKKIIVEKKYNGMCKCPRCSDIVKTLENTDDEKLKKILNVSKIFAEFSETVIVCKNNDCHGKFIPASLLNVNIPKITKKSFIIPTKEIASLDITCPFCNETFNINDAILNKSGFKNKSGCLTTLPVLHTWSKKDILILDESDENNFKHNKNILVNDTNKINEEIIYKQKANILINELLINLKRINNKSITNLSTRCFILASIQWITKYQYDAVNYFFESKQQKRNTTKKEKEIYKVNEKKYTKVLKGNEATIHQTIFNMWINEIEKNILEFTKIDNTITKIEDLKWFKKKINNDSPRKIFKTNVLKSRITSKNEVIDTNSIFVPKIVKVYSIKVINKDGNVIDNIKDFAIEGWQTIIINSKINGGATVVVDALFMSGHPTNAPTQRIIRLRKNILGNIVNKIKEEEETGEIDEMFWNNWRNNISLTKIEKE